MLRHFKKIPLIKIEIKKKIKENKLKFELKLTLKIITEEREKFKENWIKN